MTIVNVQHAHPYLSQNAKKREYEEKRKNTYKTTIAEIGHVLVQKGYASEQDIKLQEDSMFKAVEIITSVNLKTKYPSQTREKTKGMKMTREEKRRGNTEREQLRRDKQKDAIDHMREIIRDKKLGTESQRETLEQVTVLKLILDYVRTLPTATVCPSVPDMPFIYTEPAKNVLQVSQPNDLSALLQIVAQSCPSPIELSKSVPIPSVILNPLQLPVLSDDEVSLYSGTSGDSTPGLPHIQSGSSPDFYPASVSDQQETTKRQNKYKTTITDIGHVLVQKGYALKQDLNSQEDSMFKAIEIITSVNLKTKYPVQTREKTKGMKMTREEKRRGNTEREQLRRDKQKNAMDHMREIIRDKKLGTESQREKLEQVTVLELILDYIRTLPAATVFPSVPVKPFSYTAPEPTNSLNTISLMSEVPQDSTIFEMQLLFDYLESQNILQDIINIIKEDQCNELKHS
ncbi:hypothetical protein GCK72_022852 [Caenorhabditis remanei]|uniref:BHLH domain-containing protein n=1 Tax=Caenorhabditis remanei TaxID=31234 RepID=A0A6A5FUV9_CAERE|nr:hypothetical protein GCK72_022852 [Caenorhabditis remanei]KAF1746398.1 hypothetical protein GCK72_022852 [Caenorhabditis remanei]